MLQKFGSPEDITGTSPQATFDQKNMCLKQSQVPRNSLPITIFFTPKKI